MKYYDIWYDVYLSNYISHILEQVILLHRLNLIGYFYFIKLSLRYIVELKREKYSQSLMCGCVIHKKMPAREFIFKILHFLSFTMLEAVVVIRCNVTLKNVQNGFEFLQNQHRPIQPPLSALRCCYILYELQIKKRNAENGRDQRCLFCISTVVSQLSFSFRSCML